MSSTPQIVIIHVIASRNWNLL